MITPGKLPPPSILSRLLRIVGTLLTHAVALCFVLIVLVKTVPMYTIFFERQNVALPEATRRIVLLSEFCVAYWFIVILFVMVADAAILLILAFAASKKGWLLGAYSHLCLLAAIAVLVYVAAWLSHPVYNSVR